LLLWAFVQSCALVFARVSFHRDTALFFICHVRQCPKFRHLFLTRGCFFFVLFFVYPHHAKRVNLLLSTSYTYTCPLPSPSLSETCSKRHNMYLLCFGIMPPANMAQVTTPPLCQQVCCTRHDTEVRHDVGTSSHTSAGLVENDRRWACLLKHNHMAGRQCGEYYTGPMPFQIW